mgnify:CR=1 FL=1
MFTGIIETLGKVRQVKKEGRNVHLTVEADFTDELKIDQSVAHNGVCLTVVAINNKSYTVTAIDETLLKSNIGDLSLGSLVNLERCLQAGQRLDGHVVQGHVDQKGVCNKIEELDGSWKYWFTYQPSAGMLTVTKGSICVNGVSLTVVDSIKNQFSIALIPYTYEHTNFKNLSINDSVNLEFDIIGKYVARLMEFNQTP